MTDEQSRARHAEMMAVISTRIDKLAHSLRSSRRQSIPNPDVKICRCGREWEDHSSKAPHGLRDSGCKAYFRV